MAKKTALMASVAPLTEAQKAAADEYVRGQAPKEIAVSLGVTTATVRSWLGQPNVLTHIAELQKVVLARTGGKLAEAYIKSLDVLIKLLDSPSPRDQLEAARTIMRHNAELRKSGGTQVVNHNYSGSQNVTAVGDLDAAAENLRNLRRG